MSEYSDLLFPHRKSKARRVCCKAAVGVDRGLKLRALTPKPDLHATCLDFLFVSSGFLRL